MDSKIPKIIHYIWLGGAELPKIAKKCINSWKKFCPDYEIKRWDETNLNIDINKYCRQAYDMKKFAFASDVQRFEVLKREGGIYLDIDVELVKPLDDLLDNQMICGFETSNLVNPGVIIGTVPNHKIVAEVCEGYMDKQFVFNPQNQETVCNILTNKLIEYGLKTDNTLQSFELFKVFPAEYFSPKSLSDGKIRKTKNTYAIHHFVASWLSKKQRLKSKILQFAKRLMGEKLVNKLKNKNQNKQKE